MKKALTMICVCVDIIYSSDMLKLVMEGDASQIDYSVIST